MANKKDERAAEPVNQDAAPPEESQEELQSASKRLEQAREQLQQAEEVYAQVKQRVVEEAERIGDASIGENVDRALDVVRKYPGLGVIAAAALGFCLGKMFRR